MPPNKLVPGGATECNTCAMHKGHLNLERPSSFTYVRTCECLKQPCGADHALGCRAEPCRHGSKLNPC
eukprot:11719066-Alexandrium_andersonii.AAC.1